MSGSMGGEQPSVWRALEPSSSGLPESEPAGRCGHVAVSSRDGQSLIVVGGYNPDGIFNDAWEFHLERREWDRINVGPAPPERAFSRGCGGPPLFGGPQNQQREEGGGGGGGGGGEGAFAYVFGGSDAEGNASNDLWCLDVENRTWHEVNPEQQLRPGARSNHAICRAGQVLAVHGGESSSGSLLGDLWFFHPASSSWREADEAPSGRTGPRPCPRSSHCLAFAGEERSAEGSAGRLVLFGGLGSANNDDNAGVEEEEDEAVPLNDLWVLSPAIDGSAGGGGGEHRSVYSHGGTWSLVMLDGVGPSPRSLAALVSPRGPFCDTDSSGDGGADLFLFGGYGMVEIPNSGGGGGMVDDGEEEEDEAQIIMAYIDDLWRLRLGACGGVDSAVGQAATTTAATEWADEADMGFPGESIVEGRNGHTLTWCGEKLVLFGGFVGDGFDAGVHVAQPPLSS